MTEEQLLVTIDKVITAADAATSRPCVVDVYARSPREARAMLAGLRVALSDLDNWQEMRDLGAIRLLSVRLEALVSFVCLNGSVVSIKAHPSGEWGVNDSVH